MQTTNKMRSLTSKGTKFCSTDSHQQEFDYIIQNLSKLKFLHPYQKGNKLYAMTDASLNGLGFILYQKDSTGHCSIIQVGSTCLKNAQARWHPAELELLAIQYCLKNATYTQYTVMMWLKFSLIVVGLGISSCKKLLRCKTVGWYKWKQTFKCIIVL